MTDTNNLDRLEGLVQRLERLGVNLTDNVETRVAVNPDGTPGVVATGELIESAWGNAVVDTLPSLWLYGLPARIPAKFRVECHSVAFTTDGNGAAYIAYAGGAFVAAPALIVIVSDLGANYFAVLDWNAVQFTQFQCRIFNGTTGGGVANSPARITYLAIGG